MSGYEIDETSTGGYLGVVKLELAKVAYKEPKRE